MNRRRANRLIAIALSLILHLLVLGLLLLIQVGSSRLPSPKSKELTLIPIGTYGRGASAGGGKHIEEPSPNPPKQLPPSTSQSTTSPHKEMVTRESNNPTLEDHAQKEAEKKRQEAEAKRSAKEQRQREIDSKMAGAFGKGSSTSPKTDAGSGTGGNQGVGAGFSLQGRSIEGSGGLPVRPQGFPPTRGTVVVRIVVDSSGKVVEATSLLRGTSVTNARTLNAALQAARKTRFNSSPNAPLQEGTITYHFDVE